MGRFSKRMRKNNSIGTSASASKGNKSRSNETTVTYRWSDELEDYVKVLNRRQKADCSDLRDYKYETRPAGLEKMKEDDFRALQENSPYFYEDMDGKYHFLSEWKTD